MNSDAATPTPGRPAPLRIVSPLHKANRQLHEFMAEASRQRGIEPGEGHLLSYATIYGPCPVSELARVFGLSGSTLTGMLDRLEERGMLVREPNAEDRRSFLIRTTAEGSRVATELRAILERFEEEVAARVGESAMGGFREVTNAVEAITGVVLRAPRREEGT